MPSVVMPNKGRKQPVEPSKEIGTRAQTILGPAREITETTQKVNPRFVPTPAAQKSTVSTDPRETLEAPADPEIKKVAQKKSGKRRRS